MKKIISCIVTILFVVFLVNVASAQIIAKGLKVGVNLANVSGEDVEDTSMKIGFAAGGFITYMVSEKLAIQPEIFYTMKGYKSEGSEDYGYYSYSYESTVSLNYLEAPILGVFSVNESFKFLAGPYVAMFLNGKAEYDETYEDQTGSSEESGSEDIESDDVKSPEFGLTFGAELLFNQFRVSARYSLGLTDVPDEGEFKNQVIQFMVGFALP